MEVNKLTPLESAAGMTSALLVVATVAGIAHAVATWLFNIIF